MYRQMTILVLCGTLALSGAPTAQSVTPADAQAAVQWYVKGIAHETGNGATQNYALAAAAYEKAANLEYGPAQVRLALLYKHGHEGVPRDVNKMWQLLNRPASLSDPEGQFQIARFLLEKQPDHTRTDRREVEAAHWRQAKAFLAEAGKAGHQEAQLMLAVLMYGRATNGAQRPMRSIGQ